MSIIKAIVFTSLPQLAFAEKGYDVIMPEMITKDYGFMHEIADLVRNTDHYVTDSNANITICENCAYQLEVKMANPENRRGNRQFDFLQDGSYIINIVYRIWDYGLFETGECMFYVDGLRFITTDYLSYYFTACNRTMSVCTFPYVGLYFDRFWSFEIKCGKVSNAFYYYEGARIDPENSLIYDLLDKKNIRYGDWMKQYQHLR